MTSRMRALVVGAFLIAFFAICMAADAATIKVRQTVVARQSNGAYDAAYLDGNDSSPLTWGTCPNITLTTADTQSYNLRTLCSLSGTNALTASLSKLSGTLPTGCTASTDGITCTTPSALAASALVWRATDGTPADSNSFTITVSETFVPDTTAPTVPTGCSGAGGSGSVTITCDQASDPFVSAEGAGSGVASYKIYLGGVLQATKTAPTPNIQQELAGVTVGSADGTQSCTQTGADRAMSGGGAGLGSTADQLYGCGYQISGDFMATTKLAGFAGAVTTGTAGLQVRATTAAGSIYGTARGRDSDDKANNRYRATTDAAAANATLTAAQTYTYWLKMLVESGSVTAYTSTDGNNFTAAGSAVPLSLGASPYFMAFHASGTAATNTTSTLQQINVAPTSTWSQAVSTASGGNWQVSSVDNAGNESAKGAAFAVSPTDSGCTGSANITTRHEDDFEYGVNGDFVDSNAAGTPGNRWKTQFDASAQDTTAKISTTRARYGTRAARFQVTYHNGAGTWYSNGGTEIASRNEIIVQNSTADGFTSAQNLVIGNDYWMGWSVYRPGDSDTATQLGGTDSAGDAKYASSPYPTTKLTRQSHHSPDACDGAGGNPTLGFDDAFIGVGETQTTVGGVRQVNTDETRIWNISNPAACTPNGTNTTTNNYPGQWLLDRGHWTDYVMHWRPDYDADGILEVWMQGQSTGGAWTKVVNQVGAANTRNDTTGPDTRIGFYTTPGRALADAVPASFPNRLVVYIDEWKMVQTVGDDATAKTTTSCSFQAVAPRGTRQ